MKNKKRVDKISEKVKDFNIKKQYQDSWNFVKESKKFIYYVIALFFIFGLIGFFISPPLAIENQIMDFLKNLIEETKGLGCFGMIKFIFFNNLQSSFMALILGVFLGIFPLMATISNGYLLGFVSSMSVGEAGIGSLWRILPHGIFELPAVFLSLGLGLKLGSFIFYKEKGKKFNEFFKKSLRVFVFIVLPLLIVAGIIEGLLICSGI